MPVSDTRIFVSSVSRVLVSGDLDVVPCHLPQSVVVCIMSFLLMITPENVGSISLKRKVTHLISSKSIKPLLKSRQGYTSESLERTMEESLNLYSLRISASR